MKLVLSRMYHPDNQQFIGLNSVEYQVAGELFYPPQTQVFSAQRLEVVGALDADERNVYQESECCFSTPK